MSITPPPDRKIDTAALRLRIAAAREDGVASRPELDALAADAANVLKRELRGMKTEFEKAVPRGYDAETLIRDACTAVSNVEGLWEAEPATVLGAVMSAGQLGLRLGVLGQCWITPFWSRVNQRPEATIIIGYQGYLELCYRGGKVVEASSEIVYRSEVDSGRFDFFYDEERPRLHHRPDLTITSRRSCLLCNETNPTCDNVNNHGEPIHAFYARARAMGGGFFVPRPWGLEMMREHRNRYAKKPKSGSLRGPWWDEFPSMGQKTMIRNLAKTLPKTTELAHALAADDGVRYSFSANVHPGDATEHEDTASVTGDAAADLAAATQHPADQ